MRYFNVRPEAAGELGENSVIDPSVHPPRVDKLHYEFDVWPEDGLLETYPCLIVPTAVAQALRTANITGVEYRAMEISATEELRALFPDRALPTFVWLHVTGDGGGDDFGFGPDLGFVISERALEIIRPFGLRYAKINPYRP